MMVKNLPGQLCCLRTSCEAKPAIAVGFQAGYFIKFPRNLPSKVASHNYHGTHAAIFTLLPADNPCPRQPKQISKF